MHLPTDLPGLHVDLGLASTAIARPGRPSTSIEERLDRLTRGAETIVARFHES